MQVVSGMKFQGAEMRDRVTETDKKGETNSRMHNPAGHHYGIWTLFSTESSKEIQNCPSRDKKGSTFTRQLPFTIG